MAYMDGTAKDITAQNVFTDGVDVRGQQNADVSIAGTFVATVWIQRSFDGGVTWRDIESFSAPTEKTYKAGSDAKIRIGVKTGGFTSGTVSALIRYGRY